MNEESVLNYGLSESEEAAARSVAQVVQENPEGVNRVLQTYNLAPSTDDYEKTIQLLLIQTMLTTPDQQNEFEAILDKNIDTRQIAGLAGLLAGIGGIFKKKEGGTRIGNFFRKIFGKGPKGATGTPAEQAAYAAALAAADEEKKRLEEEEKRKKRNMWLGIAGVFVFLVIVVIVIVVVTKDKKKK